MNLIGISRRIEITFWTLAIRLMKEPKLLRRVLIAFALTFSLLFSWLLVSTIRQVSANRLVDSPQQRKVLSGAPVIQTPTISSGAAVNQRKILVVVVDNFQTETPQLETIWLATYVNPRSQISLIPLFPASLSGGEKDDQEVVKYFKIDGEGLLSKELQNVFRSKQINWDHYLYLDEYGLAMLIDTIGGVDFGRGQVSGVRVLSQIPQAKEDAQAAIFAYAALARSICRQSGDLVETHDALDLYHQLGTHLRTDIPEQLIVDEWQQLRKTKMGVFCDFPSLQNSASEQK
jgi:hypothetical protein